MRNVMWVHYTSSIIGGVPGATMWKNAIDAMSVKIGDIDGGALAWDANIAFAAQAAKQGLPIEAWVYAYGFGKYEADYIVTQYNKLLVALGPGATKPRLMLDLEAEYELHSNSVLAAFLSGFTALGSDVKLCSTPIPMLPYRNRLALTAAENLGPLVPQLYWREFSGQWQDWNVLLPDWENGAFGRGWSRGFTEAGLSFSGTPKPTLAELQAFSGVLAAHGVSTIYWWSWVLAPEAWWLWMRMQKARALTP